MPAQYGLGENKPPQNYRWLYLPFMLLLALISMVLATQRIAAFWHYKLRTLLKCLKLLLK